MYLVGAALLLKLSAIYQHTYNYKIHQWKQDGWARAIVQMELFTKEKPNGIMHNNLVFYRV